MNTESLRATVLRARSLLRTLAPLRWLLITALGSAALSTPLYAGTNTWTPIGPDGGLVGEVRFHSTVSSIVYLRASTGFHRSTDGGSTWQLVSADPNTLQMLTDPANPDRVYLVLSRKLFISTDRGATFSAATVPAETNGLSGLSVSPDGNVIYGVDGVNLCVSTDRAQTWQPCTRLYPGSTDTLVPPAIDPSHPDNLYVSVFDKGMYASTNAGATWQPLVTTPAAEQMLAEGVQQLVFEPGAAHRLWALTNAGLLFSTDDGAHWTVAIENGGSATPHGLVSAIAFATPGLLYASVGEQLWKTSDLGLHWTNLSPLTSAGYVMTLAVDPAQPSHLLAGGTSGIVESRDAGATWVARNTGVRAATVEALVPAPGSGRVYLGLAAGGMHYVAPESASVAPVNNASLMAAPHGLSKIEPILVQSGASDTLIAAFNGQVLNKSTDGGNNWSPLALLPPGFEALSLVSSPADTQILYASGRPGVVKSTDGGAHWNSSGAGLPAGATPVGHDEIRAIAIGTNPALLYAASNGAGAFKSTDAGQSWQPANTGMADQTITALALDPRNDLTVYAATQTGVFKSTDGAASWRKADPVRTTGYPFFTDVAVDAANSNIVYANSLELVLRSVDGGDTWQDLRSATATPIAYVQNVVVDPLRPHIVLLGTRISGVLQLAVMPDLSMAMSAPAGLARNTGATYSLTVRNRGPFHATRVRVNVTLPASATAISATSSAGTCTTTGTSVACSLDALLTDAAATIAVNVTPAESGDFRLAATVQGAEPDSDTTNDSAASTLTVGASAPAPPADPGSSGGGGRVDGLSLAALALLALACARRRQRFATW